MKLEIERKFLIHPDRMPRLVRGQKITQGYLSVDPAVRVRIRGVKSFVTIKFGNAFKREEYEWIISKSDSTSLLQKCQFKIEKTRFTEGLLTVPVEVTVRSTLRNLAQFIRHIENHQKFLVIENLRTRRINKRDPEILESRLLVSGFVQQLLVPPSNKT